MKLQEKILWSTTTNKKYLKILHDEECWCVLIQRKRVSCFIFEISNEYDFDKVAKLTMDDLHETNFLIQIYGTVKR